MFFKKSTFVFICCFICLATFAQKEAKMDSIVKVKEDTLLVKNKNLFGKLFEKKERTYNPLAPSKAAFFSAIFPGMGQAYNKKYWKTPIVWAGLAIPTYYYLQNNEDYKRVRNEFRLRSLGLSKQETSGSGIATLSDQSLERFQTQLKENRELSLLSFVIVYVLQIAEASVNAHLLQFETNDNLSVKPIVIPDPLQFDAPVVGLTLKYNF